MKNTCIPAVSQSLWRSIESWQAIFCSIFSVVIMFSCGEYVSHASCRITIIEWTGKLNYGCRIHMLLKGTMALTCFEQNVRRTFCNRIHVSPIFHDSLLHWNIYRYHISKSYVCNDGELKKYYIFIGLLLLLPFNLYLVYYFSLYSEYFHLNSMSSLTTGIEYFLFLFIFTKLPKWELCKPFQLTLNLSALVECTPLPWTWKHIKSVFDT